MTGFPRVGEMHTLPPLQLLLSLALFVNPSPPLAGLLDAVFAAAAAAVANASSVELWRFPLGPFGFPAFVGRRAIGLAMVRNGCCWEHVVGVLVVSVKKVEVDGVIEVLDGRQNIGPKHIGYVYSYACIIYDLRRKYYVDYSYRNPSFENFMHTTKPGLTGRDKRE